MTNDVIKKVPISSLNLQDSFFDSLKNDYEGFDNWIQTKATEGEEAYVLYDGSQLLGFLYLKDETEADNSIVPAFVKKRRLKIGTFKIDSHGTVLGQRFLSIILSKMINDEFDFVYLTLFKKQTGLINLFETFGFQYWGTKNQEQVYFKDFTVFDDVYKDFPRINLPKKGKHLLGIYPKYHTKLFPDSKLITEKNHIIEDLSFTNTCEKIYLCSMTGALNMNKGDLVVIYRTKENHLPAEYSSVATSICTVVEVKNISNFKMIDEFLEYCGKGTIFTKSELENFWKSKTYPYIIKMLYNVALKKRITRNKLIEEIGLNRLSYYGYLTLSDDQFKKIIEKGEINEGFIINQT